MGVFSRACLVFAHVGRESCGPCQLLRENSILENILTQISEGVHENDGYAYYGFSALSEVLTLLANDNSPLSAVKTVREELEVLTD